MQYLECIIQEVPDKIAPTEPQTTPIVQKGKTWRDARHLPSSLKGDLPPVFSPEAAHTLNTPPIPFPARRNQFQPEHLPTERKTKSNTKILGQLR